MLGSEGTPELKSKSSRSAITIWDLLLKQTSEPEAKLEFATQLTFRSPVAIF